MGAQLQLLDVPAGGRGATRSGRISSNSATGDDTAGDGGTASSSGAGVVAGSESSIAIRLQVRKEKDTINYLLALDD